mgnify:FL=1
MNKESGIIPFLIGFILGAILMIFFMSDYFHKILIEHKVAYYDISTGKFTLADKTNSFYFIKVRDCVKTNK